MEGRPRANTSFLAWRRPRTETTTTISTTTTTSTPSTPPLSIEALIEALTPPAVPSLTHARALTTALTQASPLPRRSALIPVLASLCHADAPVALQAAGYDILFAYCEHNEAPPLPTDDRLAYFSLFLGSSAWVSDLWEPRFKAFRALTKFGRDVVGIEQDFLALLQSWIAAVFDGLLQGDSSERLERERSIDVLSKFLADALANVETIARIPEARLAAVLDFYAGLVDRSVLLLAKSHKTSSSSSHRRNPSSLSSTSTQSSSTKHPADIAISLYLDHLASQLKVLSPDYLPVILPLLFRALAFCSTPLPRLSVSPHPVRKQFSEDKITDTLNALFSGTYATRCMLILKKHLFPPSDSKFTPSALHTSLGAHRTFRIYVRRALRSRLARAYISRESSLAYSSSGAPGYINIEQDLMERAWPSEDYTTSALGVGQNGWDAGRLGRVLTRSVQAWIAWPLDSAEDMEKAREGKEDILEQAAGVPYDLWQEMEVRGDDENTGLDEEEACVIGEMLEQLVEYIVPLKNRDGTPYILPLGSQSSTALAPPTPLLRRLCNLLSRDHAIPTSPLLSTILIRISDNLTDASTAAIPFVMSEQHDLSPTSPSWLSNWSLILLNRSFMSPGRQLTRRAVMDALTMVYESVRDMRAYRIPLADLVLRFCRTEVEEGGYREAAEVTWRILGDEVVLRVADCKAEQEDMSIDAFVELLVAAAEEEDTHQPEEEDVGDMASIMTTEGHHIVTHSPMSPATQPASMIPSPNLSRTQSEYPAGDGEKDKSVIPTTSGIMSIISSLTTGHSSRSQSQSIAPQATDDVPDEPPMPPSPPPSTIPPRVVAATSALIFIFSQVTFTPLALQTPSTTLSIRIYLILLRLLKDAKSPRARLTALQFLMRIRSDRDHRLYYSSSTPSHVSMLASLIHRTYAGAQPPSYGTENTTPPERDPTSPSDTRKSRPLVPLPLRERGRDERALSRGRASTTRRSHTNAGSRSASRVPYNPTLARIPLARPHPPLWCLPETYPFEVVSETPSEELISYDPDGPNLPSVLPISQYLMVITGILEKETSWDVLAYVLCHFPVQLSNKHLFCGPKARAAIAKMLTVISTGILNGEMATHLEDQSIKPRDAQGLAYHTLTVLVSYRRCFELKQCHLLIEVFQTGLSSGLFSTIKCCLHALSLSAVELQSSMTKCLPRILEMLSQIMSGANMAVHILGFLFLIGAIPPLYANFTESDYRMVFGVALQYLQHYNHLNTAEDPNTSWALSQHVRILSYTVVYVWFLALKLPDRPKHIRYITRQLLLANEGNAEIDDPTEVCFDWLARYTYASADPRPAPSVFNDIVMNPPVEKAALAAVSEKTWVYGHALITIRTLVKRGWIEVLSRRPSGYTKFLCRVENTPLVGAGDVDPDLFSIPATLMMERNPAQSISEDREGGSVDAEAEVREVFQQPEDDNTPHPNPVTGYVWSGTAPSQRRKDVSVDPAFFALQLSPYPDRTNTSHFRPVADAAVVKRYTTTLDRIPVIDTHKVGILYVAPGQTDETEILRNTHGSPAYIRFLEGLGRLINLRDQLDVYAGGLDPDEDGEYAYAWWDDIGQVLYHTATMMPTAEDDPLCTNKKRHIGNDYVRIVWNDSGKAYKFDTLSTQFQFVNIVIEPHSLGAIAAFSNNLHENEYFKVTLQRAPRMTEFAPIGHFKLISAETLPLFVRQLSRLSDWFASVFAHTQQDTVSVEMKTNWRTRLESIRRFKNQIPPAPETPMDAQGGVMNLESARDFTTAF
ncbi:hypothetical protein C0991_010132 [Blastosporella zonata]|nr:hypothetical protein C0991_010132 [Blastosporella zonata]